MRPCGTLSQERPRSARWFVRCGVSELSGGGGGVAGWSRTGDTNGPMWAAYPCVAGAAVGHHWHPVCRALTWHSHSSAH